MATVVVLAAAALGLAAVLAAELSLEPDELHALTDSASRAAAPMAPMTPIFLLTSHLR
jgi:Flp pilus assembly protein CpaB